jgi:hypothetical protein
MQTADIEEAPVAFAVVVALLDAGVHVGETLGLKWGAIPWDADDDPARALGSTARWGDTHEMHSTARLGSTQTRHALDPRPTIMA